MGLISLDLEELKRGIAEAANAELPLVETLRQKVRNLEIKELGFRQCYAVAPVATDGGENRLSFEPLNLEIVRVVDSEGREHVQKVLPLSAHPKIFEDAFASDSLLANFLSRLGVVYKQLSYLLPHSKELTADVSDTSWDNRGYVRTFRDIVEWAVLLELAWNPGRATILLLRDGLLRTKALKKETVPKMAESFSSAYKKNSSLLLGVAKRSKVLNYLSLALVLEGTFRRDYPCFAEVPKDIEAEAYRWDRTWIEGHCFGKMHLVKLVETRDAPVLPVDIPQWLMPRRKEVLEYLAETAKASFPVVGYPHPLVRAHENAVLRGLEMSVLGDILVKAVLGGQSIAEAEKILEHVRLGRGLSIGGIKGQ